VFDAWAVADYFTMWTEVSESAADLDLGGTVRRISWRSSPTEIVSYGFPGSRKP
jgi:hypothetical protein